MDESGFDLEENLSRVYDSAMTAFKQKRFPGVVELLGSYLRRRPDDGWAWYILGRALPPIGLYHEAETALRRADEFPENHPRPLIWLGHLYEDAGDYDRAETCYAEAVRNPKAAEWGWVWIFRGGNFARANQLAAALDCHRHALTLSNTDHDEAWLNIGLVLRAMGKYDDADDAFRKAIDLTPDYPDAREALASLAGIDEAIELAQSIRPK